MLTFDAFSEVRRRARRRSLAIGLIHLDHEPHDARRTATSAAAGR